MRRAVVLASAASCVAIAAAVVGCGGGSGSGGVGGTSNPGPGTGTSPPETPAPAGPQTSSAIEGLVIADPVTVTDGANSYVSVKMLTQGKVTTLNTESVPTADVPKLTANLVKGALVSYQKHESKADTAKVPAAAAQTFVMVYRTNKSGGNFTFDSMKFGPELQAIDGIPGKMAAAGWVYGKDLAGRTITVSDGAIVNRDLAGRPYDKPIKRYEETYKVADDVAVYNVNTNDYTLSKVAKLADVPVTADYRYSTTSRQQAYLVFDKSYRESADAKVVAIYYFTPLSTSSGKPYFDIGNNSSILDALGTVPAWESSVYAGVRYNDIPYVNVNYEQGSEPFEIVKDTLYSIGDNEVATYLIKTKDRLILIDAGWPTVGYQYWKNIEAMGVDPRKITDLMLTHAHSDHYGTAVELITMIENAGGKVKVWGGAEEVNGITTDAQGNVWNKTPTLPASQTVIREKTSQFYEYGKTYDFGNVKMTFVLTPGHTNGTPSFHLDVLRPENQQWLKFFYQGGYGWSPLRNATAANGWQRLIMMFSLSYLQQATSNPLILPQHTDMSPLLEAYQAVKAYNRDPANAGNQKTVLDALMTTTGGVNEFENLMEKRYQSFANPLTDAVDPSWKSVTTWGPYKPGRESGLSGVTITLKDGGKIIRGFNKAWNINSNFPLLKDGIVYSAESYQHDPNAYYVQFYADV